MRIRTSVFGSVLSVFLGLFLLAPASAAAQSAPEHLTVLHGSVHRLAQSRYDRGSVEDALPMRRLLLTMNRPADREANLQQFLRDSHTPGSASYHQWLTPEQYGARFGATEEDLATVSTWLQQQGFSVTRVSSSRAMIEFSGTAGLVRSSLHAEIHRYDLGTAALSKARLSNGNADASTSYYANATEIAVPDSIASRIRGFAPLHNFPATSLVDSVVPATYSPTSHRATSLQTLTSGSSTYYALAPEDFATQYNVAPVYKAGTDGTGQTIGIIGTSNINLALVDAYRKLFNLPASHTQVIVDGNDPGVPISPNVEAFLDVEVSGAVAPNATVNFYIAGGDPFQDPLALATLRAIEDNQASVLSLSYGACEQQLGNAGNQLWNGLWSQAAAQGQTVMVSSGDTGPTICEPVAISNGEVQHFPERSVNGLSSTPWNISVGGTDFYYSDYVSGAPSITTSWNRVNDISQGSLRAPLAEQPWDNALGLNARATSSSVSTQLPSIAGGGGPSSCSTVNGTATASGPAPCISGYPKPAWQAAPGVPNDGVRDLPDISLFAANGANWSAWPICALPGQCVTSSQGYSVYLVGGTSASAPAMAGIMALVNQKYGRQGQANFTLYALARQPGLNIFHDVTVGTNDVLCFPFPGVPDCTNTVPGVSFGKSFGVYAATPGYDLATGLGSVDVNQLISNWTKASFQPSTTTLQLSPTTLIHGTPVSLSASVAATSGRSIPTGDVTLTSSSPLFLSGAGALPLTAGAASSTISSLPGGSYTVTAGYSGDGTFGPSSSTPVSVTVTPEPSSTNLKLRYLFNAPSAGANLIYFSTITAGAQVPFGSGWHFEATPTGQASGSSGSATGSVTFTDGTTTATIPVAANGVATWNPQNLAIGSHSVSATYSGDASYNQSTAAAVPFTVVKGTPLLTANPDAYAELTLGSSSVNSYQAGSTLVVHVVLRNQGSFVPPTGNVTVTLGSQSQSLPVTAINYINQGLSNVFATFTNVPVGTFTLSANYSGDSNWNAISYTYPSQLTFAQLSQALTITSLSLTPSSADSSGSVTFSVTVNRTSTLQGSFFVSSGVPVHLYANGTEFASVTLNQGTPNSLLVGSGTATIPATALPSGSLQVQAVFPGDFGTDAPSVSAPVPLTITATEFTLASTTTTVNLKSGASISVPLNLGGPAGSSVAVTLSCAPSSTSVTCSVPSSATVSSNGTATLTFNAFVPGATASSSGSKPRPSDPRFSRISEAGLLAAAFVLLLPGRRRRKLLSSLLSLTACALFVVGCSNSKTVQTGPATQNINAPTGTYSVVITGVSGGITHNTKLNFVVQ